jgi:hypothetical protein
VTLVVTKRTSHLQKKETVSIWDLWSKVQSGDLRRLIDKLRFAKFSDLRGERQGERVGLGDCRDRLMIDWQAIEFTGAEK